MQDYRKLFVWQKAHQLALDTYAISAHLQRPDAWPLARSGAQGSDFDSLQHRGRNGPWNRSGLSAVFVALLGFLQRT